MLIDETWHVSECHAKKEVHDFPVGQHAENLLKAMLAVSGAWKNLVVCFRMSWTGKTGCGQPWICKWPVNEDLAGTF